MTICANLQATDAGPDSDSMIKALISAIIPVLIGNGPAQAGSAAILAESCAVCHAQDQRPDSIPPIRGLARDDLVARLTAFAGPAPTSTIMHRFVAGLTQAEIEALADHITNGEGPTR